MRLTRRQKTTTTIGAVALAVVGGTGAAVASSDDDAAERPIVGEALQRATDAALDATGGGEVTDTEVGDEESHYEVEVTLDDGSQVDVQLDESFRVLGTETDAEEED